MIFGSKLTLKKYCRHVRELEQLENEARIYLSEMLQLSQQKDFESITASWNYATNITDENEKAKLKTSLSSAALDKEIAKNLTTRYPNWKLFKDFDLRRMMEKSTTLGSSALPDDQLEEVIYKFD